MANVKVPKYLEGCKVSEIIEYLKTEYNIKRGDVYLLLLTIKLTYRTGERRGIQSCLMPIRERG